MIAVSTCSEKTGEAKPRLSSPALPYPASIISRISLIRATEILTEQPLCSSMASTAARFSGSAIATFSSLPALISGITLNLRAMAAGISARASGSSISFLSLM